jgi:hypothetical protein
MSEILYLTLHREFLSASQEKESAPSIESNRRIGVSD